MTVQVILLFLVTGVLVFLVYTLVQYAFKLNKPKVKESMDDIPYRSSFEEENAADLPPPVQPSVVKKHESGPAPIHEMVKEEAPLPSVAGQTEEELKEPEPLQHRVSQKVDEPSNYDKFDKNENQALFGSNLRHPEAMITKTDGYATLETDVAAQVASPVKNTEASNDLPFNAEMAQNGGEFMKGILAFDTSEGDNWFSSL